MSSTWFRRTLCLLALVLLLQLNLSAALPAAKFVKLKRLGGPLQPVSMGAEPRSLAEVGVASSASATVGAGKRLTVSDIATRYRNLASGKGPMPSLDALRDAAQAYTIDNSALYKGRNDRIEASKVAMKAAVEAAIKALPEEKDPIKASAAKKKAATDAGAPFLAAQNNEAVTDAEIEAYLLLQKEASADVQVTSNGFTYTVDKFKRVTHAVGYVVKKSAKADSNPNAIAGDFTDLVYEASTGTKRPKGNNHGDFDAGHIIGAQLGGAWTNGLALNFFPQERKANSEGKYYETENAAAAIRELDAEHAQWIEIELTFDYDAFPVLMPKTGTYTLRWNNAHKAPDMSQPVFAILAGNGDYASKVGWKTKTITWLNA